MSDSLQYPVGSHVRNLTPQLDQDENDQERTTPVGSIWLIDREESNPGQAPARHLSCPATGAWIIPDIETLERDFAPLNAYEERQEARRARYLAKSGRAMGEADSAYAQAKDRLDMIPMGQPILVGHHSERRHRNHLAKIDSGFRRSLDAVRKSEHYAGKAASVGTGGISSDDPDAIAKLEQKLARQQQAHEKMKAANRLVKKNDRDGLAKLGFSADQIDEIMSPTFGRPGFSSYTLTNSNSEIRRLTQRIASLKARAEAQPVEIKGQDYTYCEDPEDNRVQFYFEGKPDAETRDALKNAGFRFSPKRPGMPWVRQLNNAGRFAGKRVRDFLDNR